MDFMGFLFPTVHRIGTPEGWNSCSNIRAASEARFALLPACKGVGWSPCHHRQGGRSRKALKTSDPREALRLVRKHCAENGCFSKHTDKNPS